MGDPTRRAMKRAKQLGEVPQVSLLPRWAFCFPPLTLQMHYSSLESKGDLFLPTENKELQMLVRLAKAC